VMPVLTRDNSMRESLVTGRYEISLWQTLRRANMAGTRDRR
jgi:hypothetical protein